MSWKLTTLWAKWSKKENDILFGYPASKSDGHYLYGFFEHARIGSLKDNPDAKSFTEELEARGYDLKTLKFSIKKKVKNDDTESKN